MNRKHNDKVDKDNTLEDSEAEAASPVEDSIAGEEDPGAALEEFVKEQESKDQKNWDRHNK